jgi:hypothetical protein
VTTSVYRIEFIGPPTVLDRIKVAHFSGDPACIDFRTIVPPPKIGEALIGYDDLNHWASVNWGTPFMAANGAVLLNEPDRFVVSFETLGGTPDPIFKVLAKLYPVAIFFGYGMQRDGNRGSSIAAVRGVSACAPVTVDDDVERFMRGEPTVTALAGPHSGGGPGPERATATDGRIA